MKSEDEGHVYTVGGGGETPVSRPRLRLVQRELETKSDGLNERKKKYARTTCLLCSNDLDNSSGSFHHAASVSCVANRRIPLIECE